MKLQNDNKNNPSPASRELPLHKGAFLFGVCGSLPYTWSLYWTLTGAFPTHGAFIGRLREPSLHMEPLLDACGSFPYAWEPLFGACGSFSPYTREPFIWCLRELHREGLQLTEASHVRIRCAAPQGGGTIKRSDRAGGGVEYYYHFINTTTDYYALII